MYSYVHPDGPARGTKFGRLLRHPVRALRQRVAVSRWIPWLIPLLPKTRPSRPPSSGDIASLTVPSGPWQREKSGRVPSHALPPR